MPARADWSQNCHCCCASDHLEHARKEREREREGGGEREREGGGKREGGGREGGVGGLVGCRSISLSSALSLSLLLAALSSERYSMI